MKIEEFLKLAEEHDWDSLSEQKPIIMQHLKSILNLRKEGILPSIDSAIICPDEPDCCGTLLQTETIGIAKCNECGLLWEFFEKGD